VHPVDHEPRPQRLGLAEPRIEREKDEQRAERDGGGRAQRRQSLEEILSRVGQAAREAGRRARGRQFR